MLSYRHIYHAGNTADVLKHSVLSLMVQAFLRKDKPFSYLETHAGAGRYCLDAAAAQQTDEARAGILRLFNLDKEEDPDKIPEALLPYYRLCKTLWDSGHIYPGSPEIVRALSRDDDRLILMELHTTEIENLRENLSFDKRLAIHHRNGLEGLIALTPPKPARGFALIDPSYEGGKEFSELGSLLIKAKERWNVGSFLVWYPLLLKRQEALETLRSYLSYAGFKGFLDVQIKGAADRNPEGMFGSGMMILNPPWQFEEELRALLPWICNRLGKAYTGTCERII